MKGAPRQIVCSRGHDMESSRRVYPNGDTYCYECKRVRHKKYRAQYPDRMKVYDRASNLRKLYSLEPLAFQLLLIAQGKKCAICRTDNWGLHGP